MTKSSTTTNIVNSTEGFQDILDKSWPDPLVRSSYGNDSIALDDVSRLSCPLQIPSQPEKKDGANPSGNHPSDDLSSSSSLNNNTAPTTPIPPQPPPPTISRLFHPRSEQDVRAIVARAVLEQRRVGIRGTKHSMGGHSIVAGYSRGNYEIDTLRMKRMRYISSNPHGSNPHSDYLVCEPGCLWSEVIYYLNQFGKSPRTMQSYATFSVGGTISVNAHGITTDFCFAESVFEFRLVRVKANAREILQDYFQSMDAAATSSSLGSDSGCDTLHHLLDQLVEVKVCKRPDPNNKEPRDLEGEELFSLALGGYGLFGVITEVSLRVVDNTSLQVDSFQLNCARSNNNNKEINNEENESTTEFERIYHNVRGRCPKNANKTIQTPRGVETDGKIDTHGKMGGNDDENGYYLDQVDIKLARLNILNLSSVSFFVFRRANRLPLETPDLDLEPRSLSAQSQLLYKWLMPAMQNSRFALEEWTGQALDWSDSESTTRNQLLYESAEPLARLYNPLFASDDTFILQEYFIPKQNFSTWIESVREIYQELEQLGAGLNKKEILLLNTTIRYVEHDEDTFLKYSQHPDGVFAFVLYFRIARSLEADQKLGSYHDRFAKLALDLGGTFYLPYRKCYSADQLEIAYPMIREFTKHKTNYDPLCTFSNQWYEHYLWENFADPDWKESVENWYENPLFEKYATIHPHLKTAGSLYLQHRNSTMVRNALGISREDWNNVATRKSLLLSRNENALLCRRTNSYRKLMQCPESRSRFHKQFLVRIFSLANNDDVLRVMGKAVWDPKNITDFEIFKDLRAHFHGTSKMGSPGYEPTNGSSASINGSLGGASTTRKGVNKSPFSKALTAWRGLKQISAQKKELTRETITLLARLNKLDSTRSMCSIGDHGKICLNLINVLQKSNPNSEKGETAMQQPTAQKIPPSQVEEVIIVNDSELNEMTDLVGVMERGTLGSKMCNKERFLKYDYMVDDIQEKFAAIESDSMDLVTINQGMHHIPIEKLESFVMEITRILSVGGVFIFREHDMRVDYKTRYEGGNHGAGELSSSKLRHLGHAPIHMLDLAHSVFNAVTGVSAHDELHEIRAFRSVAEWRVLVGLLSGEQLEDAMLFDIEDGDCTWDEMCAFVKKKRAGLESVSKQCLSRKCHRSIDSTPYQSMKMYSDLEPPVMKFLRGILGQVPSAVFAFFKTNLEFIGETCLPPLIARLKEILSIDLPNSRNSRSMKQKGTGFENMSKTFSLLASNIEPMINGFLGQVIDICERLLTMMKATEVKAVYDIFGILNFPELFLVVPWFQRRVRYSENPEQFSGVHIPGGVSDTEKMIVQTFRKYAPIFLQPETVDHNERKLENRFSTGGRTDLSLTASSRKSSIVVRESQISSHEGQVTAAEILARLSSLELAIPSLLSMRTLQKSGLSLRQQSALAAQFIDKDREQFAEILSSYLADEREVWNAMCIALNEVERSREEPTLDRVIDESKVTPKGSAKHVNINDGQSNYIAKAYLAYNSPWHRVTRSFLCSKNVLLTPKAQFGMSILGLSRLRDIYSKVKSEAKRFPNRFSANQKAMKEDPAFAKISSNALALLKVADSIGVDKNVKRVELRFNHRSFHHLTDVGRILKATFGYTSLTSRPTDITMQLKKFHEDLHLNRVVDIASILMDTTESSNEQKGHNGTERCSEIIRIKELLATTKATSQNGTHASVSDGSILTPLFLPGSLYVTECLLSEFRNDASGIKRNLDDTRKAVVRLASLGQAGSNVLRLEYVVAEGHPPDNIHLNGSLRNQDSLSSLESRLLSSRMQHSHNADDDKKMTSTSTKSTDSFIPPLSTSKELNHGIKYLEALASQKHDPIERIPEQNLQASTSPYSSAFHIFSHSLFEKKLYKKLHLNQSGQYTWYKLPEWLQVEIIREFGKYLDHTPWYRFPFSKILGTYFSVLRQECKVVHNKYGIETAFFSAAFLTDAIPGIVMSFLFMQMSLLAKPLLMLPDYDSSDQERMCEQIVLYLPEGNLDLGSYRLNSEANANSTETFRVSKCNTSAITGAKAEKDLIDSCVEDIINNRGDQRNLKPNEFVKQNGHGLLSWFQKNVDERISSVEKISSPSNTHSTVNPACLLVIQTPPFKPFGEILFRLALKFPNARVLEISNQPEVQIKISMDSRVEENKEENLTKQEFLGWFSDLDTSVCVSNVAGVTLNRSDSKGNDILVSVDYTLLDKRYIGLGVKCPILLNVLRRVAHLHPRLRLEQVYDFWS